MKQKNRILLLAIALVMILTACGNSSLTTFQYNMNEFLKDITKVDNQMNKIDPDSEDAVSEMLECMNAMNKTFEELANIKVPTEFLSIETLADEASEYMDMALDNYSEAFSNPASYDASKGKLASEYLKRALKRKEYIAIILQGDVPEGEGVVITYDSLDEESTTDELINF